MYVVRYVYALKYYTTAVLLMKCMPNNCVIKSVTIHSLCFVRYTGCYTCCICSIDYSTESYPPVE